MMVDLLIKGGRILDGTGSPWFKANVGIKNGRIATISRTEKYKADRTIDAEGLIVSPGFIDIHSHADIGLDGHGIVGQPLANSLVRQGITTFLGGNCGSSAAPGPGKVPSKQDGQFPDFKSFFKKIESTGTAVNIATLIGHGTLRNFVMSWDARPPTCNEMDEVLELVKVAASYGGIYTTHKRGESKLTFLPSVMEAIDVAERTDIPVIISHIETHYDAWGLQEEAMRLLDDARERGVDVATDVCTIVPGNSSLKLMLPLWAREGGLENTKKILRTGGQREKIKEEIMKKDDVERAIAADQRWDLYLITGSKKHPEFVGKTLADYIKARGMDPWDLIFDAILEEEFDGCAAYHKEEDIRIVLKHPTCAVMTDAGIFSVYKDPSKVKWGDHPRGGITYPLVFRKYVRGETRRNLWGDEGTKLLMFEEAVKKMTGLPARNMRVKDRGFLMEGMMADIVVFDGKKIKDTATFEYPYLYPEGIYYVIVNGVPVIDESEHTGSLPGKIIKRAS